MLQFQHNFGDLRVSGQARGFFDTASHAPNSVSGGIGISIDELYADYSASDFLVVFAGRRNMAAGQSLGINPADVFLDASKLDRSLPPETQRAELEGIDMAGAELFFNNGAALLGYWAPTTKDINPSEPSRAYLSYRTAVGEMQADLTFFAFNDDRPGVGISGVIPYHNGLLLYGDLVARQGRSLPRVTAAGDVFPTTEKDWEGEATLGLSYPFSNGLTANLEYSHLSQGYNQSEWDRYIAAIDASNPPNSALAASRIAALGNIAEQPYLRSNYAFLRLYHPNLFSSDLEMELSTMLGLDDGSGTFNLRINHALSDNTKLALSLSNSFGARESEFARSVEKNQLGIVLEAAF
ncbi:hypothetical protein RA19_24800 [Leisingera sp. ANG-M1]|nr:hypothetical protein RA19_24800 [Leisingera sp. ANG-M1]